MVDQTYTGSAGGPQRQLRAAPALAMSHPRDCVACAPLCAARTRKACFNPVSSQLRSLRDNGRCHIQAPTVLLGT